MGHTGWLARKRERGRHPGGGLGCAASWRKPGLCCYLQRSIVSAGWKWQQQHPWLSTVCQTRRLHTYPTEHSKAPREVGPVTLQMWTLKSDLLEQRRFLKATDVAGGAGLLSHVSWIKGHILLTTVRYLCTISCGGKKLMFTGNSAILLNLPQWFYKDSTALMLYTRTMRFREEQILKTFLV